MFGLSSEKLLILLLLAVFILGPERLPQYTRQFAQFIKKLRRMANSAQAQMKDELGEGFDDLDWRKLDPRQYDPRRIVREALLEEKREQRNLAQQLNRAKPVQKPLEVGEAAPFDPDAT